MRTADDRLALVLLGIVLVMLAGAGISPYDRRVFALEVVPWVGMLAGLVAVHRRFPLTPVSHLAIFGMCVLLVVGAHHTYSRVPLGLSIRETFGLGRNPYDRIVHFAGGFVGGIVVREVLLRRTRLVRQPRTFGIVSMIVLAGAALYEILEWWIALLVGRGAAEFLAMQGDQWDTQADMFLGLLGGALAQLCLARLQDRQMRSRGLKREA